MLAGVGKVKSEFIADVNEGLAESGFALIPFNDFLTITCEADCRHNRKLPGRTLEKFLPGGG
jgi:hypothetical protein